MIDRVELTVDANHQIQVQLDLQPVRLCGWKMWTTKVSVGLTFTHPLSYDPLSLSLHLFMWVEAQSSQDASKMNVEQNGL